MNDKSFKVAILFNEDAQIIRGDPQDLLAIQGTVTATQNLYEALTSLGYPVIKLAVRGNLDKLEDILCSFPPEDTFFFNNCDGFNGNNLGAVDVIRLIERMGFKHTGAAANSIELCIDKPHSKERLIQCGVPTPRYQVFERAEGEFHLEFPVIIKPSVEDASMGIDLDSVVSNRECLFHKIAHIVEKYEQPAIVEEFVYGRELMENRLTLLPEYSRPCPGRPQPQRDTGCQKSCRRFVPRHGLARPGTGGYPLQQWDSVRDRYQRTA
ncbi:MAG: hypothetical protein NTV38_01970 [Chloroflexi bacterium]|nr:hypothetical protein [Chloroflexota bacterium]